MKPSEDRIDTDKQLLELMEKKEGHTHSKENDYPICEVGAGLVSSVVGEANDAPPVV